ncbi:hypothetical protein [Komagataeibacter rhaeticus]|uniref:hypothetical protein n=1 Tax=Komagataeibacter rhaeticus TaxID=215221 RepID=UPI0039E90C60
MPDGLPKLLPSQQRSKPSKHDDRPCGIAIEQPLTFVTRPALAAYGLKRSVYLHGEGGIALFLAARPFAALAPFFRKLLQNVLLAGLQHAKPGVQAFNLNIMSLKEAVVLIQPDIVFVQSR